MTLLVADASVVGAVVFGEPRTDEAVRILTGRELVAPPLIRYEIGTVARTKVMRDPESSELVERAFSYFLRLPIKLIASRPKEILRLSMEYEITYYDAAYLGLTLDLGVALATFDARLAQAHDAIQG